MKGASKDRMKLVNTAWVYVLLAMTGDVFYREFTRLNGFMGRTILSVVHTRLFLLGMIFSPVAALFQFQVNVAGQKRFHLFHLIYNTGMTIAVVMLTWRSTTQVQGAELSRALDAPISGIAGIGRIYAGTGVILYLTMLKAVVRNQK